MVRQRERERERGHHSRESLPAQTFSYEKREETKLLYYVHVLMGCFSFFPKCFCFVFILLGFRHHLLRGVFFFLNWGQTKLGENKNKNKNGADTCGPHSLTIFPFFSLSFFFPLYILLSPTVPPHPNSIKSLPTWVIFFIIIFLHCADLFSVV